MREYNNYDSKTNDEESDPCLAAEVRMKKRPVSARTRRNLVILLVLIAFIATLSVLLFLILSRSKETTEEDRYREYVRFDVPEETSTVVIPTFAAVQSLKDSDLSPQNLVNLSQGTLSFYESARNFSNTSEGKLFEEDTAMHFPAELHDTESTTPKVTSPGSVLSAEHQSEASSTTLTELKVTSEISTIPVSTATIATVAEETTTARLTVPVTIAERQTTTTASVLSKETVLVTIAERQTTTTVPVLSKETVPITIAERQTTTTVPVLTKENPLKFTVFNDQESAPVIILTNEDLIVEPVHVSTTVAAVPMKMAEEVFSKLSEVPEVFSFKDVLDLTSAGEAKDCEEFFARGARTDGMYSVSLQKVGNFNIVCDMTTSPGGWNVIQRRQDASVFFDNRTWDEYAQGFGELNTSFWLGLEKIYALVAKENGKPLTLRIEIRGDRCDEGDKCSGFPDGFWFGEWDFRISDAKNNYSLMISPAKAGNLTEHTSQDKFYYMNNGRPFTTVDRDNDRMPTMNCAKWRNLGGWWHHDCGYVALNGRYEDTSSRMMHLFWHYWSSSRNGSRQKLVSYHIKPRFTEMKIRRRQQ